MSRRARSGRRRLLSSPWLALLLLAGAVWVNVPQVRELVGGQVDVLLGGDAPDLAPMDEERGGVPGASPVGGGRASFAPVRSAGDLPDPFFHPPREERDEDEEGRAETPAADAVAPPPVSLVLRAAGARRAMVGGELVGVGDRLASGVVEDIRDDGVWIGTASGRRVFAPLLDIDEAERRARDAARAAGGDEYDETEHERRVAEQVLEQLRALEGAVREQDR